MKSRGECISHVPTCGWAAGDPGDRGWLGAPGTLGSPWLGWAAQSGLLVVGGNREAGRSELQAGDRVVSENRLSRYRSQSQGHSPQVTNEVTLVSNPLSKNYEACFTGGEASLCLLYSQIRSQALSLSLSLSFFLDIYYF